MKLKGEVIAHIRGYDYTFDGAIKKKLCEVLGVSMNTIYKHLRENLDDGELTKLCVLYIISEMLAIPMDELTTT